MMKCKRVIAAVIAGMLCVGVIPVTAFAKTNETTASVTDDDLSAPEESKADEQSLENTSEDVEESIPEEVPYQVKVNEDGTVVFSFGGEDLSVDWNELTEEHGDTGTVVTEGSRLNVRTGAGMDYEIIDQLLPGEEVSVIGVEGDWYEITIPEKHGYVHSDYLEVIEEAGQNSELDKSLLLMLMSMFMGNENAGADNSALTPDGNLTLVDDIGSADKSGKQFITAVTKNGNYFYLIIDRDDEGKETVHFLNQVDEADLLTLMSEEDAAQYAEQQPEPEKEPESTASEPEKVEDTSNPEQATEKPKTNFLPVILTLLALAGGGGFFLHKKVQEKKKEKESEKPDPDADYVEDEDDYGYDEEFDEDDGETGYTEDDDLLEEGEDDNEPI